MAIYLTTGRIGSGKTLKTILDVIKRREESLIDGEKRTVYYSNNIRFDETHPKYHEVADWICLKPSDLRSIFLSAEQIESGDDVLKHPLVKPNSIIVVDECHFIYPNRSTMAKTPPHVIFLSMLRHSGLDFYMVSQKDTKLDPALRDDTKYHTHLTQVGDAERSNFRYSDDGVLSKADAVATSPGTFPFPKEYYGLYHSATKHVGNKSFLQLLKSLPLAVKVLIPVGLCALIFVFVLIMNVLFPALPDEPEITTTKVPQTDNSFSLPTAGFQSSSKGKEKKPVIYLNTYVKSRGDVLVTFSYVNPDKTQITVSIDDLISIGYKVKEVRSGIYTVNGKLVTHAPVSASQNKEKKNETP